MFTGAFDLGSRARSDTAPDSHSILLNQSLNSKASPICWKLAGLICKEFFLLRSQRADTQWQVLHPPSFGVRTAETGFTDHLAWHETF